MLANVFTGSKVIGTSRYLYFSLVILAKTTGSNNIGTERQDRGKNSTNRAGIGHLDDDQSST